MNHTTLLFLPALRRVMVMLFCLCVLTTAHAGQEVCPASASWVTNPNPPEEIPLGKDADFCQFYQFSWQWFLQLVSPSKTQTGLRNFQVAADYPLLEGQVDGKQQNSCDADAPPARFFLRIGKSKKLDTPFIIPKRTGQAGGGDTIYDQDSNVVFFDIRFSRNLCDVGTIQSQNNFPSGTTELKSAWRIISEKDKSRYFWMEADVDGVPGTELLGMIGFHFVRATALHPEFVWATFEHKDNAPDCGNPQPIPGNGWSFTSKACAKILADGGDRTKCKFNEAKPSSSLTGTPTEICRVYPHGTAPGDLKAEKNIADIDTLNDQLVGPKGILTALADSNPMAVWKNYFIVGALWESDVSKPSSDIGNQRGSLRLANTVMETTFQDVDLNASFVSNCFGCHNYEVQQSNTLPSSGLSHILDDIMQGQCATPHDVNAGPIWNNQDAQSKCPQTCKTQGGWNGQWKTTQPGQMSVCGCCGKQ